MQLSKEKKSSQRTINTNGKQLTLDCCREIQMGCVGSSQSKGEGGVKKIRKPKPWKLPQVITKSQLMQMREEFWDTASNYGGRTEIWEALRAAAEADPDLAQTILERAGVSVKNPDMSLCCDEQGTKYELPKYVLSDPTNLIQDR